MDIKEKRELVKLYFEFNPHYNKGIGFKSKAFDIISSYADKHNKSYEDIKLCIESNPMSQKPIWQQFYDFFFKKENKKEDSSYKNSLENSTNIEDWL